MGSWFTSCWCSPIRPAERRLISNCGFRANSFDSAFQSITKIVSNFTFYDLPGFWFARSEYCVLLLVAIAIVFTPYLWKEKLMVQIQKLPVLFWMFLLLFVFQLIIQFKDEIVQPFIYFQF